MDCGGSGFGDPLLLCKDVGRDLGLVKGRYVSIHGLDPEKGGGLHGLDPDKDSGLGNLGMSSNLNFGDASVNPVAVPPDGFVWKFTEGMWALFPDIGGRGRSQS